MFNKTQIVTILSQLFFGMLGALIIQLLFLHFTEKVETVNITGLTDSFVKETVKQNLSAEDKKRQVVQFGEALDSRLKTIAATHHIILVPSEAVIAGSIDITDDVEVAIKKDLKQ